MKNYSKLTLGIVVGWFIFALSAAGLHVFNGNPTGFGLPVAIAALAPIVIFSIWVAASKSFRDFVFSLNPRILTYIQSWRVLGVTFVILEAHKLLPAVFALPAGYGDMAIGATAGLVAATLSNPSHRNSFIVWQILGMSDLVMAVGLGTTAHLINPLGVPISLMTVLPLSLVPTFIVPLLFMFHVIAIAQARTWTVASDPTRRVGNPTRIAIPSE